MSAAAVVSVVPVTAEEPEDAALALVLGDGAAAAGQRAARLAALLDPGFLAEAGWDPATWLLAPETEHRLIRWDGSRRRQEDAPARREAPLPAPDALAVGRRAAGRRPSSPIRGWTGRGGTRGPSRSR